MTTELVGDFTGTALGERINSSIREFKPDEIVKARVLAVRENEVVVDYGGKSEGSIPRNEFADDMRN